MGDLARMQQHFEEIDQYVADRVHWALAARHDRNWGSLRAITAQVRDDGYTRFAAALENLGDAQ